MCRDGEGGVASRCSSPLVWSLGCAIQHVSSVGGGSFGQGRSKSVRHQGGCSKASAVRFTTRRSRGRTSRPGLTVPIGEAPACVSQRKCRLGRARSTARLTTCQTDAGFNFCEVRPQGDPTGCEPPLLSPAAVVPEEPLQADTQSP